jgi:lipopolysaccharide/colanic/teichoic acid biosynthesis glycosyltransferase
VTGLEEQVKRVVDVLGAGVGLVLAAPVLGAAALAIRREDGGPVLFRQERVGRHGRPFTLLKLRTMIVDAHTVGAGYAVDRGDARITRTGDLLRRTAVDELPQLVNVLRGDMSLVGPRPTLQYQVDTYTPRQRRRLEVRPGLTGWAQLHGRARLPWSDRIELDVWYVEHRSLLLDLRILLRTVGVLLRPDTAYKEGVGGWTTPAAEAAKGQTLDEGAPTAGDGAPLRPEATA